MFKFTLQFACLLAVMLLGSAAIADSPVKHFAKHQAVNTVKAPLNGPVIYNQLLPLAFGSIVSHEMTDAANAPMTSFAADDFIVPAGENWNIQYVNMAGVYMLSTGTSIPLMNVAFYEDSNGMPGGELFTFNDVSVFNEILLDATMGAYLYEITLPQVVNLSEGTYWIGISSG